MRVDTGLTSCTSINQKSTLRINLSIPRFGLILIGLLLAGLFLSPAASADFDYIFFSVNGDSTQSSMTQGDEFFWGSNCDTGSTINWEVWYDANGNSLIDPGTDVLLTSENITDGNPVTEADPILDGFTITAPFVLSGEPGVYIFRATDFAADSSLQKTMTMVAMPSPPNQLSGQINLPGITAPNSLLANHSVFAESETGDEGAFLAITDNMGMYSMNVGAGGTGVEFYIDASNVNGFVAPGWISAVASGVVPNNDFTYEVATDSVWGFVKDETDAVIPFEVDIRAQSDIAERQATTSNGRYVIYFAGGDAGEWDIEVDSRISPVLLSADRITFDLDLVSNFQQDIILTRTDTAIYVRVTESGAPPANRYRIDAYSALLESWSEAVSGTGSDNTVAVYVSSLDPDNWTVYLNQWDDEYPIPFGMVVSAGDAMGVSPGDTVDINLISGKLVSGTVTQDPEDDPINWDDVYVNAGTYGANPDGGGGYAFYAATGDYFLGVYADGYLAFPGSRHLPLTADTSNGLDFVINRAHHRVSGTLTNVSLPLDNSFYWVYARTGSNDLDGYIATAQVDSSTGTFELYLCDGDWVIEAPCCFPDVNPPDSTLLTIGEIPDTTTTLELVYSSATACCGLYDAENRTGNVNYDPAGQKDLTDILTIASWAFLGGPAPPCAAEANVNGDAGCIYDLTDALWLASAAFLGGAPPAYCMPECE